MKKAKLRNEIEKVLDEVWGSMRYDSEEATDKILSLLEGRLKKEPSNKDSIYYSEDNDAEFYVGWNACLEEIKEKIK